MNFYIFQNKQNSEKSFLFSPSKKEAFVDEIIFQDTYYLYLEETTNLTSKIICTTFSFLPEKRVNDEPESLTRSLEKILDINELIHFGKRVFPESKQYLFELLTELIEEFDLEEGDDLSVGSLKGMLLFLYSLKKFKEPDISISETGLFYLDWEEEMNNSLTVRFRDDFILEYSLFQPSNHTDKLNIKNGKVHVLDFKEDLSKLGIKWHKEI